MKISSKIYDNKSKNANTFGNFLKVELPLGRNDINKITVDVLIQKAHETAGVIKSLAQGELKVYRRSLDDMDFIDRFYEHDKKCAKFIYVDDAEGKNQSIISAVKRYLLANDFYFIEFQGKLLEKSRGIFRPSMLCRAAYYAKPEQMIVM